MHISETIEDPYLNCENGGCRHELCDGVRIEDLLNHDGPFKPARVTTYPGFPIRLPEKTLHQQSDP